MLSLARLVGQRPAVAVLEGLLRSGRVPHALLFQGPAGVGKATAARAFAAGLNCEGTGAVPCGLCPSCLLIDKDTHPDVLWVGRLSQKEIERRDSSRLSPYEAETAEADLGQWILVDQIRTLNGLVGLRPRQGRRRVFIIDPAERMNREAQNSLLKTLEEPPERSVLILVSPRPHALLPTVRSRVFAVGFTALRTVELSDWLAAGGMERDEAGARAALAWGSPGRALTLDLEALRARRAVIGEMLETLAGGGPGLARLPELAATLAGPNEQTLGEGLDLLESLLRDAARAGASAAGGVAHADLADRLARLGQRLRPARAAALVESLERLRGDLRHNANRLLVAEALLAAVAGGPLP